MSFSLISLIDRTKSFQGNPNTAISSVGGSITASRTTAQTPAFIQVSGSGLTCVGTRSLATGTSTAVPYEDLELSWDFGDPTGTEVFTRPTDGVSVNANKQTGPEALYCYRIAGMYTITLTVRGKNGSGFTTQTFTQSITVTTFSASGGTRYVDSANGNNSWDGTSPQFVSGTTGPWADFTASGGATFATFMASGNNKALYVAQGSIISGAGVAAGIKLPSSAQGWRIGSYVGASGAGAKPIVNSSTATMTPLELRFPGGAGTLMTDIVVSNINFTVSDG